MEKQKESLKYTEEDCKIAELLSKAPRRCVEALEHMVAYMDTPFLDEIFLPDTSVERLYELECMWMKAELYELLFLTAFRIAAQDGSFDEKKLKEAKSRLEKEK